MPFIIICWVLIIGAPVLGLRLKHKREFLKYRRRISQDVKNRLISSDNYQPVDPGILRMVKAELVRQSLVGSLLFIAVTAAVAVLFYEWRKEPEIFTVLGLLSAAVLVFFIARAAVGIIRLSSGELVKVKAFVFRRKGWEKTVIYYDMPRMDYRFFGQNSFLMKDDQAELGSFVNLIGIKTKRRVKIIRILSF